MIEKTQEHRPLAVLLAALLTTALGGCASTDGRFPSLAVRDAERLTGELTPSVPSQEPISPVASAAQVSDFIALALGAHREFAAITPQATSLMRASRGTGPTSDARAQALVALAQLTSLRSQTALALANLDALEAKAATTFAPTVEIKAAQMQVTQIVNEQDATLDSLTTQMAQ